MRGSLYGSVITNIVVVVDSIGNDAACSMADGMHVGLGQ